METTYNLPQYEVDESWGPKYDGTPYLPWYAFDKKYLPEHYLKPVPWQAPKNDIDKFFRTGMNINNSASITRSISGTNLRFFFRKYRNYRDCTYYQARTYQPCF